MSEPRSDDADDRPGGGRPPPSVGSGHDQRESRASSPAIDADRPGRVAGLPTQQDPRALHGHARHNAAIVFGVGSTARLITGAALIIIVVFSGFAAGELVSFQQMGFGVAAALLIDATIVRLVVIPAAMRLLGERNWYLPPGSNGSPTSRSKIQPYRQRPQPTPKRIRHQRRPSASCWERSRPRVRTRPRSLTVSIATARRSHWDELQASRGSAIPVSRGAARCGEPARNGGPSLAAKSSVTGCYGSSHSLVDTVPVHGAFRANDNP